jgi:outer membrane protein OmpA-like peptidoglycan-associated protein
MSANKAVVAMSLLGVCFLSLESALAGDKAETITFDKDDLSLAKVILAGLNPTARQQPVRSQQIAAAKAAIEANPAATAAAREEIEANKKRIEANQQNINEVAQSTAKRFSELGQYPVKDETTVYFATGDYTIAAEYKQPLADPAKKAFESENPKAYLIQVSGFADSVGSAADNRVLSKHRAEAVVAYLLPECGIPVVRIVAPVSHQRLNCMLGSILPSNREVAVMVTA